MQVKRRILCDILVENKGNETLVFNYVQEKYNFSGKSEKFAFDGLRRYFLPQFREKWKSSSRSKSFFYKKYASWLEGSFTLFNGHGGRPNKTLENCSNRSKRRKVSSLSKLTNLSVSELHHLLVSVLKSAGKKKEAELINDILENGAQRYNKITYYDDIPDLFTKEEALALITDTKLTKYQYEHLRNQCKLKNYHMFPRYASILAAKKECYPSKTAISESGVELQSLLDQTVRRLLLVPDIKDNIVTAPEALMLVLESKWGCDGSSGQSVYKQNFLNPNLTDESVFMSSLVPIQLTDILDSTNIFWKNKRPSSTNYCRPISFHFAKETKSYVTEFVKSINDQISELVDTKIEFPGKTVYVKHNLFLTMIDGKVCQILTGTSSSACCNICGAKPSEMNNMKIIKGRQVNQEAYKYGLSPLHALIRFMECVLHVSYRLGFKKWAAKSSNEKEVLKSTKFKIQSQLKEKLGILVDMPKQGSGTSNDGNTARRFFKNFEMVSEISGFNPELLRRFAVILQVINTRSAINETNFEKYTYETANIFIHNYQWYYMPSSLHKVLIHGGQIIKSISLPIGQLSEEAAESRNKDFKRFRQSHSRKFSRVSTNEDVIHALLISSDPLISSLRHKWQNKNSEMELYSDSINLLN